MVHHSVRGVKAMPGMLGFAPFPVPRSLFPGKGPK